jgi:hypothetical protein
MLVVRPGAGETAAVATSCVLPHELIVRASTGPAPAAAAAKSPAPAAPARRKRAVVR